ncbi:hypothetical protein J5TS2_02850 [Brevibacillus halotolerans]|nr:hypothetical protein J5TS2_02850 [Brevibacillus halotolerans]
MGYTQSVSHSLFYTTNEAESKGSFGKNFAPKSNITYNHSANADFKACTSSILVKPVALSTIDV